MFFPFLRLKRSKSNSKRLSLLGLILLPGLLLILSFSGLGQRVSAENKPPNQQLDNLSNENQQRKQFAFLQQKLIDYGFTVKLEIPPYANRFGRKPYGLVRNREKTVWINPIVFDLGNALPVLIHEAVHAAQICAGDGNFSSLDIDLEAPQIALPYFLRYHNLRRELEAEAYIVQTQPNSFELAKELLDQHCSSED